MDSVKNLENYIKDRPTSGEGTAFLSLSAKLGVYGFALVSLGFLAYQSRSVGLRKAIGPALFIGSSIGSMIAIASAARGLKAFKVSHEAKMRELAIRAAKEDGTSEDLFAQKLITESAPDILAQELYRAVKAREETSSLLRDGSVGIVSMLCIAYPLILGYDVLFSSRPLSLGQLRDAMESAFRSTGVAVLVVFGYSWNRIQELSFGADFLLNPFGFDTSHLEF
jgi:hypothetical protein